MNNTKFEKRKMHIIFGTIFTLSFSLFSDTIPGVPKLWEIKNRWCWAATSESIIKYYIPNLKKTQAQIAGVITSQNQAVSPEKIIKCIEQNGKAAGLKVKMVVKALSWEETKAEADAKRPFISMVRWNSGGYHCMVYAGYIKDKSRIKIMDPIRRPGNWKYRSYSKQVNSGTFRWERTYLVTATTPINKNTLSSVHKKNSFIIVYNATKHYGSGITFLFNNYAQQGNVLSIYNALGTCLYEHAIDGRARQVSLDDSNFLSSGTYYAVIQNQNAKDLPLLEKKPFTLIK